MFLFENAIVKEKAPRGRWIEKDLSQEKLIDLYSNYHEVYLILSHPLYSGLQSLNIQQIPGYLKANLSQLTVVNWLAQLGNTGLPVSSELPSTDVIYAPYRDAFQACYSVKPVNTYFHHDVQIAQDHYCDLRLTKEGVDYQQMFEECLVTVNGFFHRTNFVGDGVHVLEGARSGFHANENGIGVYHLGRLGKVQTVPIRVKHVYKGGVQQPMGEAVWIEVDEAVTNINDKSVLLVIGGYLHLPDRMIHRVAEGVYRVEMKDYLLAQRFYEMQQFLKVTDITRHLSKSSVNAHQVAVEELYSDQAIQGLFKLSQSFFVVVDTPELFVDKEAVEFLELPGKYVSYTRPKYPLVTGLNRFHEYWFKREYDRYVLSIRGGLKSHYQFETTHWKANTSIDNSLTPHQRYSYNQAQLFKLGKTL